MSRKRVIEALTEFFKSPEGEALVGTIVMKALSQYFTREVVMEDGKSEPGRVIERAERVDIFTLWTKYVPYIEGALRGMQTDVHKGLNRCAAAVGEMTRRIGTRDGRALITEATAEKEVAHDHD